MNTADLSDAYRNYIACLNQQNWQNLQQFVHGEVAYNGKWVGLSGYRDLLVQDFVNISGIFVLRFSS